jgi:hypothetical protein
VIAVMFCWYSVFLVKNMCDKLLGKRIKLISSRIKEECYWNVQGPFEKFVDWQQCAAVMQREAVTVMLSCSDGGNIVVA